MNSSNCNENENVCLKGFIQLFPSHTFSVVIIIITKHNLFRVRETFSIKDIKKEEKKNLMGNTTLFWQKRV